jgi:hypothetical protein
LFASTNSSCLQNIFWIIIINHMSIADSLTLFLILMEISLVFYHLLVSIKTVKLVSILFRNFLLFLFLFRNFPIDTCWIVSIILLSYIGIILYSPLIY